MEGGEKEECGRDEELWKALKLGVYSFDREEGPNDTCIDA